MRLGPSSTEKVKAKGPRVARVRHVANAECLTHIENALCGARNVTSVAIKIISIHVVGLSSQEPGTESPVAHPEDVRAKVSHIIPGLVLTVLTT